MTINLKKIFFAIFLIFCTILKADIPEKPTGYINDFAAKLSLPQKQALENKLTRFEEQTSNQIFVLIYPSLEGKPIEEFTHEVARKWKIGQKDKNNGVLLGIFVNDRKVRIEVGYGLEGALPDITAKQIIENEIKPALRANNYYGAVDAATNAIIQATQGEYKGTGKSAYKYKIKNKGQNKGDREFGLFLMIFVVIFIMLIVVSAIRAISHRTYQNTSHHDSGYSGGYYYGGYYDSSYYSSSGYSDSSWGSDSSFGGGGGGDFGGGGASGEW
ncbi:MAG: TPM domain-containing protein [Bacteroidia bacterium]|nr:TPM domain-containing protein [Bacteroidia bacterium]MDW8346720.1 TPM domain-containing protein [Bacteroidia bacterium]